MHFNTIAILNGHVGSSGSRGGGQGGHAPPPPSKNRPKKGGCQMRWLIFHVSCPPPFSEVSGSATVLVNVNGNATTMQRFHPTYI